MQVAERLSTHHVSTPNAPALFVVWIETNLGTHAATDWEMNSAPQPIQHALREAEQTRAAAYPTLIAPAGWTPRPDGLFSNPVTDPTKTGV